MPEKKTKHYTAEFKELAAKLAVESNLQISTTASELGMQKNIPHAGYTIYRLWQHVYHINDNVRINQ